MVQRVSCFDSHGVVVTLPRAQAYELDARGVGEQDLARDHAVEHQQSEVLRARRREPIRVPHAASDEGHPDGELGTRFANPLGRYQPSEVESEVEQRRERVPSSHHGSPGDGSM